MNPGTQALAIATSIGDQLATLAGFWPNVSRGQEQHNSREELDAFRNRSNAVVLLAEAGHQVGLAGALCRFALLSEIWKCLANEPDQAAAAAELADFCQMAIKHLVRDQGPAAATRGSATRSSASPTDAGTTTSARSIPSATTESTADEPVSFDEACTADDDAPPALDQETLLRILSGSVLDGKTPAPSKTLAGRQHTSASDTEPQADKKCTLRASATPEPSISTSLGDEQSPAGRIKTTEPPRLEIPALPTRCDLDDEMREAFLADAIDLFERIERIVVGLGSQADKCDELEELSRCFHTLKGAAGSVGLTELATFVHELEERLGQTRPSRRD